MPDEEERHSSWLWRAGMPTPALFLDIDGTVRHGPGERDGRFVNTPDDVVVFPEAVEMMRRWRAGGGRVIGVSNQGGVALGHLALADCVAAMERTQELTGSLFDVIVWCVHHPDAADPVLARCWCRKPSPGLLIEAATELGRAHGEVYPPYMGLMVGDRPEDEECARIASIDFQPAGEWRAQAVAA